MEKELIKLKGTGDGVRIYLDGESTISDLSSSLYDNLRKFRKFFGNGHCNIYFAGRELTSSDKMRLEAIVKAMLPESTVDYGDGRIRHKAAEEKTLELPENFEEEARLKEEAEIRPFIDIKNAAERNFKSSRARFFEGNVSKGKSVESDGHLILVGNVYEDGVITAVGNIVVFGKLYGKAHAGCMGNDNAYVLAYDMKPADIRISKNHAYFEKSDFKGGAKKAFLSDGRIVSEDYNADK